MGSASGGCLHSGGVYIKIKYQMLICSAIEMSNMIKVRTTLRSFKLFLLSGVGTQLSTFFNATIKSLNIR